MKKWRWTMTLEVDACDEDEARQEVEKEFERWGSEGLGLQELGNLEEVKEDMTWPV